MYNLRILDLTPIVTVDITRTHVFPTNPMWIWARSKQWEDFLFNKVNRPLDF